MNEVYWRVLGRAPDQGGYNGWLTYLTNGGNKGEMMMTFTESPEFQAKAQTRVFVTMMYSGMLCRAPDEQGYNNWVGYIGAGNSRLQLTNGFLYSTEYRLRFMP